MLTAARLRELLNYDSETGIFTQLGRPRIRRGAVAGGINSNGYVLLSVESRRYRAQRLAWLYMTGEWPPNDVDHRDGDRTNNRWTNLRAATRSQNLANQRRRRDNRSGLKGVSFDAERGLWRAQIAKDEKRIFLGRFRTKEEAAVVYARKAVEMFGAFARMN